MSVEEKVDESKIAVYKLTFLLIWLLFFDWAIFGTFAYRKPRSRPRGVSFQVISRKDGRHETASLHMEPCFGESNVGDSRFYVGGEIGRISE